jgi:hypothetical protein
VGPGGHRSRPLYFMVDRLSQRLVLNFSTSGIAS